MTVEDNKALARRFYEQVLNTGKLELLEEVLSQEFVDHGASGDQAAGVERFQEFLK